MKNQTEIFEKDCKNWVLIRNPYNYDRDSVSENTGLLCRDESRTIQEQKEDADINTVVRRFGLTGELPSDLRTPQYGDFTGITDYQTALNSIQAANEAFMQLPAKIRSRFEHDPAKYVDFCMNPENRKEGEELGIFNKIEVKTEPAGPGKGTPEPEPVVKKSA
ncbi:MAG: internal scaffolding protein [Microvirus sp.]|nr:MAG: internal scaffolding protein [Microvirus sp.]